MKPILEVDQLTKSYRNKRGIRQIRLCLHRGDIYGLLGPNGSGKTTLLKTITGLIHSDAGTVSLFGESLDERKTPALSRVGCMIESADFYDYINAEQYLRMVARYYPELTAKDIQDVLVSVGLEAFAREKIKHFSTGMKQRLAIAAAILPNPELIILDEPTNGLDVEGIVWFRELVRKMADEKHTTFILSSHMIHELEQLCNRVGIIYGGELIQEGEVKDLLQESQTLEHYYIGRLSRAKEEESDRARHLVNLAK
ncbi:ABC transporter ATP-binding protein [Gorillibacterium massiliense]|uniref:ABC transporter ATP-binding protein n=1 Tax=Gorillibacterium massiliense TaxID=1280390 RepID=UPI0004AFFFA9|nr:ABC transporter ATP-binding protein [Gorillibacterium massiliense]